MDWPPDIGVKPYYDNGHVQLWTGDCREVLALLEPESVQCCVTSPPYWGLRDYGIGSEAIGLEPTPEAYVQHLVEVFREVHRVLRGDGTVWLNLGDSYTSGGRNTYHPKHDERESGECFQRVGVWRPPNPDNLKPKDLVGIPWRVAFALQADGWYLRSDIVWAKPNPMPESVTDRPTKAHEYLFLLAKAERYYYMPEAIQEHAPSIKTRQDAGIDSRIAGNGYRNKRTVWEVATQPYSGAHFAVFPEKLVEPCILAGCPVGGTVLDPFSGAGTTALVAQKFGRRAIGIECNEEYNALAARRMAQMAMPLNT